MLMRTGVLAVVGGGLLVVGIALAVVGLGRSMDAKSNALPQKQPQQMELAKVAVAARPIPRGHRIGSVDLKLIEVATPLPANATSDSAALVGTVARVDIDEGQFVGRANTVVGDGQLAAEGNAALLVPSGRRAIALNVSEESAVARLIVPGDRVDIFVRITPGEAQGAGTQAPTAVVAARRSALLIQNIEVLSVGRRLSPRGQEEPAGQSRTITLAATPDEVARLNLMAELGSFYLALRNPLDTEQVEVASVSIADLLPPAGSTTGVTTRTAVGLPVQGRRNSVQVIKGGDSKEIVIDGTRQGP